MSLDRDPWIETPLDRDLPRQRPVWTETSLDRDPLQEHGNRDRDPPRRYMRPGSQTGSDILQIAPMDRMTEFSVWGLCPRGSLSRSLCQRGICPRGSLSKGDLCPGGLCAEGSLSGGSLSRGLYQGVLSPRGSLSRGVFVWGISVGRPLPPRIRKVRVHILLEYFLVWSHLS